MRFALGDRRREEEEERERLDEDAPRVLALPADHVVEADRAVDHHRADEREAERDLVADHLARGAERAHERELVVARPARDRGADDALPRHREDVEDADVERRD